MYDKVLRRYTQSAARPPSEGSASNFDRSIVIPFRNEEANIGLLIIDLKEQFLGSELQGEIVLIDDHSEDNSAAIVTSLIEGDARFRLLQNEGIGKKAALRTGIRQAKFTRIISLDADVRLSADWLQKVAKMSVEYDLNILPVRLSKESLIWFEDAEWSYLQGLTLQSARAKKPLMCNGAHLEFSAKWFENILPNEYSVSSGDDMFLLEAAKRSDSVGYYFAHDFFVTTLPSKNWSDFLSRRLRWASKNPKIKDKEIRQIGLLSMSVSLMGLIVLVYGITSNHAVLCMMLYFSLAWNNYIYIQPIPNNPARPLKWIHYFSYLVLLPPYSVIVGALSLFVTPKWKGRKVNR